MKKIILAILLTMSLLLVACGGKGTISKTGDNDVKFKKISKINVNESQITSPQTIYETKKELVFCVCKGIFVFDKGKDKITKGLYIDGDESFRLSAQGSLASGVYYDKAKNEFQIFQIVQETDNNRYYYTYSLEDKVLTKVNKPYPEKKIDSFESRNSKNKKDWKMLNTDDMKLKDYIFKSSLDGKIYKPFKKSMKIE